MRQVVRFMDMPDKVIAFDGLPEELLSDLEMLNCSKLPRHWREFIGVRDRLVKIKPERDPYTGKMSEYTTVKESAPFCWVVDREINKDKEAWRQIESYVKRNAPQDFRMTDPIVDIETGKSTMAKQMAADAHSELSLEPEEVTVIPIGKKLVEDVTEESKAVAIPAPIADVTVTREEPPKKIEDKDRICTACNKIFMNDRGLELHMARMHKHGVGLVKPPVTA